MTISRQSAAALLSVFLAGNLTERLSAQTQGNPPAPAGATPSPGATGSQPGGTAEGVAVHGQWTITILAPSLSGTMTAPADFTFDAVNTSLGECAPTVAPANCTASFLIDLFSRRALPNEIAAAAEQIIQVKVTFSFS